VTEAYAPTDDNDLPE
jgi:hypothetical protein